MKRQLGLLPYRAIGCRTQPVLSFSNSNTQFLRWAADEAGKEKKKKDDKKTKQSKKEEETDQQKRLKDKKTWVEEELWKLRPTPIIFEQTEKQLQEDTEFMKRYCLLRLKQSRLEQKALHRFEKMREEALNSLPPALREAALIPDLTPVPRGYMDLEYNRPIPNFHAILAERLSKTAVEESS